MIGTVLRTSWLNLRRDPVALILTFALPLLFFSIFAIVFGAMDQGAANPIAALVVQEDDSELASELQRALRRSPHLNIVAAEDNRAGVVEDIRTQRIRVAIVIPSGFADDMESESPGQVPLELLTDSSNPIAAEVVTGVVQAAMLDVGYRMMTEQDDPGDGSSTPLPIEVTDVLGSAEKRPSIAFFAAGVGVMFLLFSLSGRSGLLIEERDSGVVTRMLASHMRIRHLLLGRWLFLCALGVAQVTVMFVWGAAVFGLDLFTARHLAGFTVMTVTTSAAAAAFGLLLAASCRTRAQLTGIASVLILVMSALGGSMFPRFLMPETLQRVGLATFNAWALDGYQKVFWYESDVAGLAPQLAVLGAMTVVFLGGAWIVARRWDRV